MKTYIENCLKYYPTIVGSPSDVVEHMFATLGNGVDLNNKGFINENYRCEEPFEFPSPTTLKCVYPWSDTEEYQPFRKLAGCRDVGFKEAAEYFIECIKLTPDTVEGIRDWKDNLDTVVEVLLGTNPIEDEYSDTEEGYQKFIEKLNGVSTIDNIQDETEVTKRDSVTKHWFFDVQWSDCPDFVEEEVRHLWGDYELGNDKYIAMVTLDEELFEEYPNIYFWLRHKGVEEDGKVIVHWWW